MRAPNHLGSWRLSAARFGRAREAIGDGARLQRVDGVGGVSAGTG